MIRQIDILGLDWIHWKPVVCQIFWRTEFLCRKYSYKTEERKTITKKNYNKIHHVSQFRQQHCQQDARSKQGSQCPWRRYTGDAIDSPILKHQLSELLSWSLFYFPIILRFQEIFHLQRWFRIRNLEVIEPLVPLYLSLVSHWRGIQN